LSARAVWLRCRYWIDAEMTIKQFKAGEYAKDEDGNLFLWTAVDITRSAHRATDRRPVGRDR
jgi:hypothetical protein